MLVLASGSGQQNRDEEILGHKPFKRIAESLAERGYAVLRMDDRGIGVSEGKFDGAVNADFVSDIRAAVAFTDSLYPGVPKGVLGHSEGGTVAVRTAVADPLCSFIITLAAPAWQGDSIIMLKKFLKDMNAALCLKTITILKWAMSLRPIKK